MIKTWERGWVDQLGGYIRKGKKKKGTRVRSDDFNGTYNFFCFSWTDGYQNGIDGATTMNEDENRPEQKNPYDNPVTHSLVRAITYLCSLL